MEQEFRGDTLRVKSAVTACRHCGFETLDDEQAEELVRRTHAEYRRKHALLTAAEIVAGRKKLSMTQEQFARHLSLSLASVKRWEAGYVQDRNSDQRIREKIEQDDSPFQELIRSFLQGGQRFDRAKLPPEVLARMDKAASLWVASAGAHSLVPARAADFFPKLGETPASQGRRESYFILVGPGAADEIPDSRLLESRRPQKRKMPQRHYLSGATRSRVWTIRVPSQDNREPLSNDEESHILELTA